jgi:transposase
MPDHADSELKLQNHWHVNDEHYVRRGENAAVDAALWKRELRQANRNRRGRPYVLPPAMLDSVRCLMVELGLSYRAAQGHLRRMLSTLGMKAPDLTTIWKRLSKEQAEPVVQPREAIIAIDSTGFSTTLRGEWMRDRWHRHRGFVKAHVAVDVDTLEVVGVVTTDDTVGDNRVFASLLEQVLDRGIAVKRVLADGAYDTRDNFDMLRDRGIEAGIKMAKDATRRSRGHCLARPLAVLERKELGQEEWERRYEYWKRWMVEYVISAVKRTLGDAVSSRRRDLMFCEVQNKFWTWNMMRRAD